MLRLTVVIATSAGPVVPIRAVGELPADDPDTFAALAAVFGRPDLVPISTVTPDALLSLNDPRAQAAGIPGGGAIARAVDVAAVYQSFVADGSTWRRDAIGTVRNASIGVTDGYAAPDDAWQRVAARLDDHAHAWLGAREQTCRDQR